MSINRRDIIRSGILAGIAFATAITGVLRDRFTFKSKKNSIREVQGEVDIPAVKVTEDSDIILRMQLDLKHSLKKPLEERKWGMLIDLRKCVGCYACTVGCISENKLPPGVVYRPVLSEETGKFPNTRLKFTPRPCMQCERPTCTAVCPVKATYKRADGIVVVDYEQCIGCRYCLTSCPYGARTSDFGEFYTDKVADNKNLLKGRQRYEQGPFYEYHQERMRKGHSSPIGNARKCHFCLHRIERGLLPVCVTTCIGRATIFGDLNNPDSVINKIISKNNVITLLPHMNTHPKVFYIL